MGLTIEIRKKVVLLELTTCMNVVSMALIIEREVNEERAEKERNQKKRNKYNKIQGHNSKSIEGSNKRSIGSSFGLIDSLKCSRHGKAHSEKDYHWNISACFGYGQKGDKIVDCP